MGFNEQQRADGEGYRGIATGPPRSLDEALGRGEGQARREQEVAQSARVSSGYESLPPRFALYAMGLLAVFLLVRGSFWSNREAVLLFALALGALMLSHRLGGLLGSFKALYVGLWGGAAVGAFLLLMQGAPLSLGNIAIHLIIGGAIGLGVSLLHRRHPR
jgi:hypothetical protein